MPRNRSSTTAMNSDSELDSDLDGGFDPVQAATDLKRAIEGHKKRRFVGRKKIEARYAARVAEIVERTEARLAEREKRVARLRQDQLARLLAAVEARDARQRAVADRLARFYDACVNLTSVLESAFAGVADEARAAVLEEAASGKERCLSEQFLRS